MSGGIVRICNVMFYVGFVIFGFFVLMVLLVLFVVFYDLIF